MKKLLLLSILFFSMTDTNGQLCVTLDSWSLITDNGNGTCTYEISVIVDSGNGANGTATFTVDGAVVHVEPNCICNPTVISFPVTVTCESTISVFGDYDAPGMGNDCSGSTGDIVLPVEWDYIRVENHDLNNLLSWSTFREINNEKFVIENSVDEIHFSKIGVVGGAGNSDAMKNYEFIHENPRYGTNYYRIRQEDFDGNFVNSHIVSVHNELKEIYSYPNPFNDIIYINSVDIHNWELLNVNGKSVLKGSGNLVETAELQTGTYVLNVYLDKMKVYHNVIVKI